MMKSDCFLWSPMGIRLVLSISIMRRWPLACINVKSAFCRLKYLKERSMFALLASKNMNGTTDFFYCYIRTRKCKYKIQLRADVLISDPSSALLRIAPQCFYYKDNGNLVFIVVWIVVERLKTGLDYEVKSFLYQFDSWFNLELVIYGLGIMKFYVWQSNSFLFMQTIILMLWNATFFLGHTEWRTTDF